MSIYLLTLLTLFKEGDRDDPCNYRPVFIIPASSKILERVVHTQVYKYLNDHSILVNKQFRFRKGHSTMSCIINLTNSIFTNMSKNMLTGVVFLDLKRVFDIVDHNILLNKLDTYGMGSNAVDWFRLYLSGRFQQAKVVCYLIHCLLSVACRKGPFLDPCFLFYILVTWYQFWQSLQQIIMLYMLALRIEISNVVEWLHLNKLTLNVQKAKLMTFRTPNKLWQIVDTPLKLGDEIIERARLFKYLGMYLDENLSYNQHVNWLYMKICSKLGLLKKYRYCID